MKRRTRLLRAYPEDVTKLNDWTRKLGTFEGKSIGNAETLRRIVKLVDITPDMKNILVKDAEFKRFKK